MSQIFLFVKWWDAWDFVRNKGSLQSSATSKEMLWGDCKVRVYFCLGYYTHVQQWRRKGTMYFFLKSYATCTRHFMHMGNFPCLFGSSWYTYLDTIQLIIVAFLQLVKIVLLPILTVFSIRFLSVIRYPHQKHEVQWKNGCFRFRISCLSASMTSLNELFRYIFQFLLIFLFCV